MPHDKFMEKLDKADKLLRQFPHGIRAVDVARKLNIHRTQSYDYLSSLEARDKAYSEHGLWFPKNQKDLFTPCIHAFTPQETHSHFDKIREDYLSGYSHLAFQRLELLADKLDLQPHATNLYGLEITNIIDRFGSPIDPLKKLKLRRAIIRRTLQELDHHPT